MSLSLVMRIHILSFLMVSCGLSASGTNIVNFEIVNSSSFSSTGGIFTSGGGTFYGEFQLDVSKIPANGSATGYDLTSWDVFTTGPAGTIEFKPGTSSGVFDVTAEQNIPLIGNAQVDALVFDANAGQDTLQLLFIEPVGYFRGGIVFDATAQDANGRLPPFNMSDLTGTGFVLDPAVIAPEPGSGLLLAAGAGVLLIIRRLRLRK